MNSKKRKLQNRKKYIFFYEQRRAIELTELTSEGSKEEERRKGRKKDGSAKISSKNWLKQW